MSPFFYYIQYLSFVRYNILETYIVTTNQSLLENNLGLAKIFENYIIKEEEN